MSFESRDGSDIRFSIRYPARSGHFSDIRYLARYRISKNRISGFRISRKYPANRILIKHFFLILKDFKFENFSIIHHISKIASIRPDIWYLAPTGYPAGNLVSSFQNGRLSGRPDIQQNCYPVHP